MPPQVLESKRLENTIKLTIISKKNWKSLDCEIFETISKSRIYGLMSYRKGNWIVCFIFKTQPLKRCFHSNKVNTSSHYRPSSFLIVVLKIFFKYHFKSPMKKYSFSDHSSEPKMRKNTHGVLNFSCFMDYEHSWLPYFQKKAWLTSYSANPWTWGLISLIVNLDKQKLFAVVCKQK